jgi:hypothetical protein
MITLTSLLVTLHLLGLSFGLGASTVKVVLLFRTKSDPAYIPVFTRTSRPITGVIIVGLVLLTLSGIGWLLMGYGFSTRLIVKLILVALIWILGPYIDNVVEPKFNKLAPATGEAASPEFAAVQSQYLVLDTIAGGLFYVIVFMWVLF